MKIFDVLERTNKYMFGIQFYPTPSELVEKMISKLQFEKDVNSISLLEPSAGKGDIVQGFIDYFIKKTEYIYKLKHSVKIEKKYKTTISVFAESREEFIEEVSDKLGIPFTDIVEIGEWCDETATDTEEYYIDISEIKPNKDIHYHIECIEIDANLCAILKDKNWHIQNADFLNYKSYNNHDVILMNPPFADGDKHLLKALKLIENGGQCVCILNAETLKNPYTNTRKELLSTLQLYGADIEYLDNAFIHSEHTTDVETAMVYVNIPKKYTDEDLLKNLLLGEEYECEYDEFDETQVATNDIINNLITQYNLEARLGIKIIRDFYSIQKYIPKTKNSEEHSMISLSVHGCSDEYNSNMNPINRYIRGLREKYWTLFFSTDEFSRLLTDGARSRYQAKIRDLRLYDFTLSNIKQLQMDLVQNLNQNLDDAILNQFDNFTYKHSLDKETNVHYFNGWKTNSAFMIKPKVIVPMYGIFDSRFSYWSLYKVKDYLTELEKIFVYLDGNKKDGMDIAERWEQPDVKSYTGTRINCRYFDVEMKKKGTVHIWFTDAELLKKFNIFGCQKHGWLPNSYGKKAYKDMNKEEQDVIDSFEGKKSYDEVMISPQKYLSGNQMLQLIG